ncbi:MAG: antibiotic biosynthesis monooxygenase [Maribacter sp.]|nr:antibiotic biosynthesis monooxygenase [Maribacter sp.]
MRLEKFRVFFLLLALSIISCDQESKRDKYDSGKGEMLVRIAAIEIEPNYLKEYIAILKEEAEASVRLEPGVICIYPMFQKENPTQIRLLEIYANKEAYASHLKTPHFKHYKETTLEMVKDLRLIDMEAIDKEIMPIIFTKLK